MYATVNLFYSNSKMASAIAKAVSPDNFKTPNGLTVQTAAVGEKVMTRIKCECNIATFTATLDDLLFSASIAEKAVRALS